MALLNLSMDWGESYEISLKTSNYLDSDKLAIAMEYYDTDYKDFMPYSILTVNLVGQKVDKDCAFVDTNNLGEKIIKWIEDNNLGAPTGRYARSGFCAYPEVRFNLDEVKKYCRKNTEE